ncbi:MAG: hypothetical protein CMH32_08455 [Micavibrio sp.]|nr:hypothetical protein [Micavibrio sp.]HCK32975.1 hypothetical protein [Rhodospirillaceae bacterium]
MTTDTQDTAQDQNLRSDEERATRIEEINHLIDELIKEKKDSVSITTEEKDTILYKLTAGWLGKEKKVIAKVDDSESAHVIPLQDQPTGASRFILQYFAAKEPKHYTSSEATSENISGYEVMVGAGLATWAVAALTGVKPMILQSLSNGDYGHAAAGVLVLGGVFAAWARIVDSQTVKSIRENAVRSWAKKYYKMKLEVAELENNVRSMTSYRDRFTAASIGVGRISGIVIPSLRFLLIAATTFTTVTGLLYDVILEKEINANLAEDWTLEQESLNTDGAERISNDQIVAEYLEKYQSATDARIEADGDVAEARARLGQDFTSIELTGSLAEREDELQASITNYQDQIQEKLTERSEAAAQRAQEDGGLDGRPEGQGPKWRAYNNEVVRLDGEIADLEDRIGQIRDVDIENLYERAREGATADFEANRPGYERDLADAEARLERATAAEAAASEYEELAAEDPRFQAFNPGVDDKLSEMWDIMSDAHLSRQLQYGALAFGVAFLEAVFMLHAMNKKPSAGERRAFEYEIEQIIATDQAAKIDVQIRKLETERATLRKEIAENALANARIAESKELLPRLHEISDLQEREHEVRKRTAEEAATHQAEMDAIEEQAKTAHATKERTLGLTLKIIDKMDLNHLDDETKKGLVKKVQEQFSKMFEAGLKVEDTQSPEAASEQDNEEDNNLSLDLGDGQDDEASHSSGTSGPKTGETGPA